MGNIGWISLHRQIVDSWLWDDKPYAYGQAWIDLLLSANHEANDILLEGQIVTIPRGSFHTSILKLTNKYGWNRKKTTKFLNLLENQKMVTTKRTTLGTTIGIVNYDKYQPIDTTIRNSKGATKGQLKDNQGATKGQSRDTNNNDNNDNNVNNDNKDKKNNINNNIIFCSEPDKSAPNMSGIFIQLNDKTYYEVPLEKLSLWKEVYQAISVEQELKKMAAWCDSNPTKRKTRRGIERFINNWLSREQDKGFRYCDFNSNPKKIFSLEDWSSE